VFDYTFDRFFMLKQGAADMAASFYGSYDLSLVALSDFVAILAAMIALSVGDRVRDARTVSARVTWVCVGGLAMGVGIWAMHFIGMLAFTLPMSVSYDPLLTVLSVMPGTIASAIALMILGRKESPRHLEIITCGVLIGAGIGIMHYMGMAAMNMQAMLNYNIGLVLVSVGVAAGLAVVALYALFFLRRFPTLRFWTLPISAVIMGNAVVCMHYTAMQAAIFTPHQHDVGMPQNTALIQPSILAMLIAAFVICVVACVLAAAFASRQAETALVLKEAEANASSEKERLQTIFDTMADGVITMDESGLIREWSASAERIFGYKAVEVIGQGIPMLMQELQWSSKGEFVVRQNGSRHTRPTEFGWSTLGTRKDRTKFPVELSLGTAQDGPRRVFVGVVRDVSERKRTEAQLTAALSSMAAALLVVDDNMRIVVCNDRMVELYRLPLQVCAVGAPVNLLVGFRATRGDFGDTNALAATNEQLALIRLGDSKPREEFVQSDRYVDAIWTRIGDEGVVLIATDVTDRKQRGIRLREAQEQAEAANEAKSKFLAVMSHEIRTPMNGIVGMIDVLRESNLTADQGEITEVIRDSAFSLLKIINDILDLSKIEASKLDIEQVPLSIYELAESVTDALYWTARQRDLVFRLSVDVQMPDYLIGDPMRLRQILINLLGNAIKFTRSDDIKLGVVRLGIQALNRHGDDLTVRFTVADNGIGMNDEAQKNLFKPFSQAESSTTRQFGGTGLGLSIVARLVDAMDGAITVTSQEGEGSLFVVDLPMKASTAAAASIFGDLSDVDVYVAVGDNENRSCAVRLLVARGARTHELAFNKPVEAQIDAGVAAQGGRKAPLVILLDDDTASMREGLRRLAASRKIAMRMVVISRGAFQERQEDTDTVFVHDNPLKPTALMRAVAVAADRESPLLKRGAGGLGAEAQTAPQIDDAERGGSLILVVEDNRNNQNVIKRQLRVLGYACEVAENGAEALSMLRKRRFGLVLTDCHMPVMDGFELTERIRDEERDNGAHQKIIAITANALQGEAERCLNAGMDHYLSKPLELAKLAEALEKWLPREERGDAAVPLPPASKRIVVDLAVIAQLYGDANPVLVKESLADFVQLSKPLFDQLRGAVSVGEAGKVRDLSHQLKSSCRAIGANDLATVLEEAERLTRAGDRDQLHRATMDALDEMDRVCAFIDDYLRADPAVAKSA
jgi:PAS domain S-box-containing protein